jgi:effector-binding domain-containing protein
MPSCTSETETMQAVERVRSEAREEGIAKMGGCIALVFFEKLRVLWLLLVCLPSLACC